MNKMKNGIIFIGIPIIVVFLLILNGRIAQNEYSNKVKEIEQNQYGAVITCDINSIKVAPKEEKQIKVNVTNSGFMSWIFNENDSINLSYHIFDEKGDNAIFEGQRTPIPQAVRRGESAEFNMNFMAPEKPGKYKIELDMVHEGVTWFKDKGSNTIFLDVEVK